jgi:hypothetical protein
MNRPAEQFPGRSARSSSKAAPAVFPGALKSLRKWLSEQFTVRATWAIEGYRHVLRIPRHAPDAASSARSRSGAVAAGSRGFQGHDVSSSAAASDLSRARVVGRRFGSAQGLRGCPHRSSRSGARVARRYPRFPDEGRGALVDGVEVEHRDFRSGPRNAGPSVLDPWRKYS